MPVFSPISAFREAKAPAHTHPVALAAGIEPRDHAFWLAADTPMMRACSGLIMLLAESWEESHGMRVERETFEAAGKPVAWMTPGIVPAECLDTRDIRTPWQERGR